MFCSCQKKKHISILKHQFKTFQKPGKSNYCLLWTYLKTWKLGENWVHTSTDTLHMLILLSELFGIFLISLCTCATVQLLSMFVFTMCVSIRTFSALTAICPKNREKKLHWTVAFTVLNMKIVCTAHSVGCEINISTHW